MGGDLVYPKAAVIGGQIITIPYEYRLSVAGLVGGAREYPLTQTIWGEAPDGLGRQLRVKTVLARFLMDLIIKREFFGEKLMRAGAAFPGIRILVLASLWYRGRVQRGLWHWLLDWWYGQLFDKGRRGRALRVAVGPGAQAPLGDQITRTRQQPELH